MSSTRNWWYEKALARPWFIYLMCAVVAAFVIPWWLNYFELREPPEGAEVRTVEVLAVDGERWGKTITVSPNGFEHELPWSGDVEVGEQVEVWDSPAPGEQWHTGDEYPLSVGLGLTALLWSFTGFAAYGVWRRQRSRRLRETLAAERLGDHGIR